MGNKMTAFYTGTPFAIYREGTHATERSLTPYRRREVEILLLLTGGAEITLVGTVYSMTAGDLIIIPPDTTYSVHLAPHSAYDCICLDTSLVADVELRHALEVGAVNSGGVIHPQEPGIAQVNESLHAALAAYSGKKRGWQMQVLGNISIALAHLSENGYLTVSKSGAGDNGFCTAVLTYIAEHYREPITSTTAAAALYLNNSYFCRLFKKHFQSNFSDFLNGYRIDRAKCLLRDTAMSVADVATATGFNSFSYFCKLFRTMTGMSPTDYRRGV